MNNEINTKEIPVVVYNDRKIYVYTNYSDGVQSMGSAESKEIPSYRFEMYQPLEKLVEKETNTDNKPVPVGTTQDPLYNNLFSPWFVQDSTKKLEAQIYTLLESSITSKEQLNSVKTLVRGMFSDYKEYIYRLGNATNK